MEDARVENTAWLGRLGETWEGGASVAVLVPNISSQLSKGLTGDRAPADNYCSPTPRTEVGNGDEPFLLVLLKETSGQGGPTSFNLS